MGPEWPGKLATLVRSCSWGAGSKMSPTGHKGENVAQKTPTPEMSSTLRENHQQEEQGWTLDAQLRYPRLHLLCVTHTAPISLSPRDTPGARCHKHFITPHRGKSSNPGLQTGTAMSYLQVPDLDLRVHGSCPKNESIRVELRTGESCRGETDRRSEPALRILSTAKVGSCSLGQHCARHSASTGSMYFSEQMSNK